MKIKDIFTTANQNLLRSPLRSLLTILAIFVGTTTLTLTTGVGEGVRDFVNKQIASVSAPGVIVILPTGGVNSNPFGEIKEYDADKRKDQSVAATAFTQEDIDKIKSVENVKDVQPVYVPVPEYVTAKDQKKYSIVALDQHVEGLETPLAAGRLPDPNKNEEILLAYQYLSPLGLGNPNDAISKEITIAYKSVKGEIFERKYTVVGVLVNSLSGSFIRVNLDELKSVSLEQYQKDLGAYTLVALTDPKLEKSKFEETKKQIRSKGYSAVSVEDQINQINTVITAIQYVLNAFAVIVISAAGIGIINTLLMAVYERTREIGLNKALGMKPAEVFYIFAIEAIMLGFWGGILGIMFGVGLGWIFNYSASTSFLKDLQGFSLFLFPIWVTLPILLGTMLVGLIAGTYPAIKASRLNPIDALRYE